MNEVKTKVLIIGSGPAGYTAAIYAARANLKPILVAGLQKGGQLTITTDVENYPGFADAIQGPWLMEQMEKQAKNVGTEIVNDMIKSVDFSKRPFVCKSDDGTTYIADTVIISTGASANWLGIPSEKKYMGKGVSACATCDGFFFSDQKVAVVGGGNSAVEEAMYLAGIAKEVVLIHRRDKLRCEPILADRLFNNDKISVIWNSEVDEILGDDNGVNGLKLKSKTDDSLSQIDLNGVFIAIGHSPATGIFKDSGLEMDEQGYLIVEKGTPKTNITGVFGAGDVADKTYRQAVTAAGLGCQSALEAQKLLESE
ncbi:MAG: thioredoxin-disulfide reductase [Alphaproteobacteria bacterium]|nr:thioredoxin-disulfide reductase [Alphaproteobacteria bacterium]